MDNIQTQLPEISKEIKVKLDDIAFIIQNKCTYYLGLLTLSTDDIYAAAKEIAERIAPTIVYICPVCNGKGQLPPYFYSFNPSEITTGDIESCRTCNGKGILVEEGNNESEE